MDVKSVNNGQFLVTCSPTESTMLNEIALDRKQEVEKTLASTVFISIVSEHADMRTKQAIASHAEYWDH